ncbi:hypothetical protein KP509_09G058000 [Ceratopteris richardii]|uniref:Legume lectin domain-containing protein n=1 Tax=Ceratopteris richardii TaxID=49495 RepID=A0A8T2UAS4_CERRI|nr:hypothetical protein KP509_09G058000 [Ceratopteris richardii]
MTNFLQRTTIACVFSAIVILVIILTLAPSVDAAGGITPPSGVSLSFPPFTSAINCSTDASARTTWKPSDMCRIQDGGREVMFSVDFATSIRYQYYRKVQLWIPGTRYAASFSTTFVVAFLRGSERVEDGNYNPFGGGIAFAMTPDQRVGRGSAETLGLFEIDERTGKSLRGANTKTFAVEIDTVRMSTVPSFNDPQTPHVGVDINGVKSTAAASLGTFQQFVDRKIAIFIDYDAQQQLLQVRLQNLGFAGNSTQTPDKRRARLYLNIHNLRVSSIVNPQSYVGFSSSIPEDDHGVYILYDWKFTTKWVPINY